MLGYNEKLKEISLRLLKNESVDIIIGFRKGTLPMMNEPHMVRRPKDVDTLIWDSNCGINLANYLPNRNEKIAILAKGCDSRNIVTHILENKIKREQLTIIGIPCQGMIDRNKVNNLFQGDDICKVTETDDGMLEILGNNTSQKIKKSEVLQDNCAICTHKNPVVYDELVGSLIKENENIDRYEDIRKIENLLSDEKKAYFDDLFSTCIRCYACKNACPLCYCPTCFVDESNPQWVGKSCEKVDTKTFHFLRAFHCAGRCTDCGACYRACPMEINVRKLTKKLEKDCLELFEWEAGLSLDKRPPLDTYRPNDPETFIK